MLRHYVARHNELALMQNRHRLKIHADLVVLREDSGGIVLVSDHLENHKNKIKDIIHQKSKSSRGEIDAELEKVLSAHKLIMSDHKSFPFKGPMNFSGGVSLYLLKNHLFILSSKELLFYQEMDRLLLKNLTKKSQIPELAFSVFFPQIIISGSKKLKKASFFIHPLLPVTCQWLKNMGISYGFAPLMNAKDRQMLINDALILDSSVLGL